MDYVIDFHTHPFIEEENNFCIYDKNTDFIADMDNAGISQFCGSVITRKADFESIKKCNRDAIELKKLYKERYIPGIHVHPLHIEESEKEIKLAHENGVKLIGELVPYMNGWNDYSSKEFSLLLDIIEKYQMVVSIHTMNYEEQEKMALEHKNVQFVFAHPGEKSDVSRHIEIMKKCENVCLDLSGTGIFRYGAIRYMVDNVGADRIVFGTDYPICNAKMYVNAVLGEKLTDRERELILGGNAKRLLGL